MAAVVAGVAGSVVAIGTRYPDDAYLFSQRNSRGITAEGVERIVKTAPEPVAGRHPPGLAASCQAATRLALRNPWRCTVRYRSGFRARFLITVRRDGSYVGDYAGRRGVVTGCCIDVPGPIR